MTGWPSERARRRSLWVAVPVAVALSVGCIGSSAEETARDLCGDLANLDETITLLTAPTAEASVGDVRGAYEKVAPVLERIAAAPQVSEELETTLIALQEAFRDAFAGVGDDEPATVVVAPLAAPREGLRITLSDASVALGCAPPDPPS